MYIPQKQRYIGLVDVVSHIVPPIYLFVGDHNIWHQYTFKDKKILIYPFTDEFCATTAQKLSHFDKLPDFEVQQFSFKLQFNVQGELGCYHSYWCLGSLGRSLIQQQPCCWQCRVKGFLSPMEKTVTTCIISMSRNWRIIVMFPPNHHVES